MEETASLFINYTSFCREKLGVPSAKVDGANP